MVVKPICLHQIAGVDLPNLVYSSSRYAFGFYLFVRFLIYGWSWLVDWIVVARWVFSNLICAGKPSLCSVDASRARLLLLCSWEALYSVFPHFLSSFYAILLPPLFLVLILLLYFSICFVFSPLLY